MESTREPSAIGKVAWAVVAAVAALVMVSSLAVVVGPPRWFFAASDCTVTVGDRTVELSTSQAEEAATVAASAVRRGRSLEATTNALADVLDASDQDARVVAPALTGRSPHALTCDHGGAEDEEPDRLNRVGLTERAAVVLRDVESRSGPQKLGGFAPGGVTDGHMPGSAHYEGRAVDVFFRPMTRQQRQRGWAMAHYLVAHAERLEVDTVIFDGHIWTARRSFQGWRTYSPDTSGRSARVAAILEHRDHVHVDVAD